MKQTTAVLLFGPLAITLGWLALGYAWSSLMQGGQVSDRTRGWIRNGCWVMFLASYVVIIADFLIERKF